ncbi:hypothetical protein evm_011932 [Chilo suppressalis]|nr:hypothetical protein evm_011932 [Chilo suppressalis]
MTDHCENISLSCTVECAPLCSVQWLTDGQVIDEKNDRYYIVTRKIEPQFNRNDFEATESTLHWNMSAWPGRVLDRAADTARYTCRSSRNHAGPPVNSTTKFAVEYEPENITVTPKVVSVIENEIPGNVVCSARGFPMPSYTWRREHPSKGAGRAHDNQSLALSSSSTLLLPAAQRRHAGNYVCEAYNRHGAVTTHAVLDVMFVPECGIKRTVINGDPVLVCTAHANPSEVSFHWKLKNDNDSLTDEEITQSGSQSFLKLSTSVDVYRTYLCFANNSVGMSRQCEMDVVGIVPWWRDQHKLILIGGIALAVLVITVILCIIIICVCRRMRAKSKYNSPVELEEREKFLTALTPDVLRLTTINSSGPPTNGVDNTANGNLGTDNPGLYENLPFHGLQQPPNKMQTSFLKQFPTIDEEISESDTRKFSSLNTRNINRRLPQFQSMRVVRKRNIERFYPNTEYGENFNEINNNKDNHGDSDNDKDLVLNEDIIYANFPSLLKVKSNISGVEQFENLTDSIQICEESLLTMNASTTSLNRPVPAPRTKLTPINTPPKSDHVYVNLSMPLITTKFSKSLDTVDAPVRCTRSAEDISKAKPFLNEKDDKSKISKGHPKDETTDESDDENDKKNVKTEATKPNIIGATPKRNLSITLPSTSLVKSVNTNILQQQYTQKRNHFTNLSSKGKNKKNFQIPLQKHHSFCYFQPIRVDKRIPVDQERSYNNTIGPMIYQPAEAQYYTKTLNRTREKNNQKLNRLKKSESLREKLSCVGVYDNYEKPDYPEPEYNESERRSYLQLLKGNYISNSTRNLGPEHNYSSNYNTVGPKEEKPRHKKLVYADLALGNHNLKFKNTVNSNRHLYDTYTIGSDGVNKDTNSSHKSNVSSNQRKGNHSQQRSDYATLKFNEIDV